MKETFSQWDAADHLKTEQDIIAYLEACTEDDPGDGSLIRVALGDIARAGNLTKLARNIGMSREGLYKALSDDGNPTFTTVFKVLRGLNLGLHFHGDVRPSS